MPAIEPIVNLGKWAFTGTVNVAVQEYLHQQEKPVSCMKIVKDLGLKRTSVAMALARLCISGLATRELSTRHRSPSHPHPHNPAKTIRRKCQVWLYEAVQDK